MSRSFERTALAFTLVLVVVLGSLLVLQNYNRPPSETVTVTLVKSGVETVTITITPSESNETRVKPAISEGSFGEVGGSVAEVTDTFRSLYNAILRLVEETPQTIEYYYKLLPRYFTAEIAYTVEGAVVAVPTVTAPTPVPATVKEAPTTYSTTNIQVVGVDEHDVVKANGTHIYISSRYSGVVHVVKAYPPEEMREVLTINVSKSINEITGPIELKISYNNTSITVDKSFLKARIQGIYLYSNKTVVIAETWYPYSYLLRTVLSLVEDYVVPPYVVYTTTWTLIYGSDGSLEDYAWISGGLVDSRLTSSKLIIVSRGEPRYWILKGRGGSVVIGGSTSAYTSWGVIPENATAIIGVPESYTTIMTYDLESKDKSAATVSGPSGAFIYVTPSGEVYVLSNAYWYRIMPQLEEVVEKLENATSEEAVEILKEITKVEPSKYGETIVVRASTSEGKVRIEAMKSLEGIVTDQFSIDVHDGVLRLALQRGWEGGFNLYTLDSKTLEVLGSLEGIAKGERVHGVRFIGDRMYIVTYRNIDPLFTIDLTVPEEPKILGYREGPGFDEYLHPWNETALIGLGFTDDRRLRVTTYTISEDGSVEQVSQIVLEDRWSPVFSRRGYHAFLLDTVHDLILFPGEIRYYKVLEDGREKWIGKGGVHVVKIDPKSLKLSYLDILEHVTRYPEDLRPVYIEDTIYTASPTMIKSYSIEDLNPISQLEFKQ